MSERETSYEVTEGWTMPELTRLVPEDGSFDTRTVNIQTSYYDTEEGTLAALGITLRRRAGGTDAGWQLKLPTGPTPATGADRSELRSGSRQSTVPKALLEPIAGLLRGLPVAEVATITTSRRTHVITDGEGAVVVEIADDQVRGTALGEPAGVDSWRELEVEAGPSGSNKTLSRAGKLLTKAGAEVARSQVKLVRLLDSVGPARDDAIESTPKPDPLSGYVAVQCQAVLLGEVALRQHPAPDTVHQTRVAVRRLRSTLRTFGDLVDVAQLDPDGTLDDDLRWFASWLGAVRDLDVLQEYLSAEIAALPADLVLGPVEQQLTEEISLQRRSALSRWRRAWSDDRYRRVVGTLEALYAEVPLTDPKAVRRKAWPRHAEAVLAKADRTARQRLAEAGDEPEAVHRARKAAKRLRYTAELIDGDLPKADKRSRQAKAMQTLLGGHQDRAVASRFLREQGARLGAREGHNGFTYGVLAERADRQAQEIRSGL